MKATVRSSSRTMVAGISPATILQKMHSSIAGQSREPSSAAEAGTVAAPSHPATLLYSVRAVARSDCAAPLFRPLRAPVHDTDGSPLPQKTYNAKPGEIDRSWYVVDADGETLGRLATRIADTLRGKKQAAVHAARRHR